MKSRAQLLEIAREIIENLEAKPDPNDMSQKLWSLEYDRVEADNIKTTADALEAVQDEALNSVLPSPSEVGEWLLEFKNQRGYRASKIELYEWFRANMKPAGEKK